MKKYFVQAITKYVLLFIQKIHHVDFICYGNPKGFSAISVTVGYTTAIIAKMILDGKLIQPCIFNLVSI